MDEDDEYSLQYKFSDQITKANKNSIAALMKNVLQRGNPFNLEQPKGIMDIATGAIVEKDEEDFLTNCSSLGKAARNEFYDSCLKEKNIPLLETVPKTKKSTKEKVRKKNMIGLKKQIFTSYDYTCLRDFNLKILTGYEISPTCFYLPKKMFDPKAK